MELDLRIWKSELIWCRFVNFGRLDDQQMKMLRERFTEDEWAFLMGHGGFVRLLGEATATVEEFAELGRKIVEVEGGERGKRTVK
jgi:hypothetical protein